MKDDSFSIRAHGDLLLVEKLVYEHLRVSHSEPKGGGESAVVFF